MCTWTLDRELAVGHVWYWAEVAARRHTVTSRPGVRCNLNAPLLEDRRHLWRFAERQFPVRRSLLVRLTSCCLLFPRFFFFFQAEDGIRDLIVTGVQTC